MPGQPDHQPAGQPDHPDFVIVWDATTMTLADYADLVTTLGNLVRASGGAGVERIASRTYLIESKKSRNEDSNQPLPEPAP